MAKMIKTASETAITLSDVAFNWATSGRQSSDSFGLSIPQWSVGIGEKLFIEGQSGSGKSTLLNIITGILTPQQGTVSVLGTELGGLTSIQRDRFRASNMGVVFQQFNLLPYLTVLDNIRLPQSFLQDKSRQFSEIEPLLKGLNLSVELLPRKASELSIGQQQRVAVARALYHRPPIIIADEPTSALDTRNCNEFIELLLEQSTLFGSTVLFVSHDQGLAHHFDRKIGMDELTGEMHC